MQTNEITNQVVKMLTDNPAKIIKIRDSFEEIFEGHDINSAQAITDREFERIRYKFREIDVPFSWCTDKDAVYQLHKAIEQHRSRYRHDDTVGKKSSKSRKKGLFGFFK